MNAGKTERYYGRGNYSVNLFPMPHPCTLFESVLPLQQSSRYPILAAELRKLHHFTRVSTAIQFVSQVLPPSSENACSKRQEFAVMSIHTLRTKIIRPLNGS